MATSTWANSWGTSWGTSWNRDATVATGGGGGPASGREKRYRIRQWEEYSKTRREKEDALRDIVIDAAKQSDTVAASIKRIIKKPSGSTHGLFNARALTDIRQLSAHTNQDQLRVLADELAELQADWAAFRQQYEDDAIALLLLSL